ncbi:DUF429 domain-containing protein [Halorarius litoreus]|uniref:DUF429 domain-containing protein n=1 Tax=Halorarius litoreus TaxID=2962676 RepID=UPI0020CB7998|nr:DUF429 domain-containing protein [Halorarius litoreus]
MDEPLYVGVDWSPAGWVAVAFGRREFEGAAVYEEVGDLWYDYEEQAHRICIDVPIGLVEQGEPTREADRLARKVLGSRRSAVFTPPVREATRKRRYPAAKRTMERKAGTGLSKQAFALSQGIAAVDELLQEVPESREVFVESHPELCFRAFAGEPLDYAKETAGGYAERMRALAEFDHDAPPTVQSVAEAVAGYEVLVDDVLDAIALGYTARPASAELRSLPPEPPTDATGLPMRLCYRADEPLA